MKPKFRAWDTENNRFFKPTYEHYKGNLEELVLSMSGCINIRTMSHTLEHESTFPNRFILNQYTGLKDKNGMEIYEGDLLGDPNKPKLTPMIVKYDEEKASFMCNDALVEENFEPLGYMISVAQERLEVVGNIYERAVIDS